MTVINTNKTQSQTSTAAFSSMKSQYSYCILCEDCFFSDIIYSLITVGTAKYCLD